MFLSLPHNFPCTQKISGVSDVKSRHEEKFIEVLCRKLKMAIKYFQQNLKVWKQKTFLYRDKWLN